MPEPPEIYAREFGVGEHGRKIVRRHIAFASGREFREYLREHTPFYISYSVALFERPGAPTMEEKGLLGADMVFEFDVDELGLEKNVDAWVCERCGSAGFLEGPPPPACPRCDSPVKIIYFPDPEREEVLKGKVEQLISDFLVGDLGFSEREISVNFSGNRGYHIHLRSDVVRELDRESRVEIVEYITGQALDPRLFFKQNAGFFLGPSPKDDGWGGRIARAVLDVLEKGDERALKAAGADSRRIRTIMHGRFGERIRSGVWPSLYADPERSIRFWVRLARMRTPYAGNEIDVQTSVDIHRLIRVPDTIHGGTGLLAATVRSLDTFYPYRDAVVVGKEPYMHLHVTICPEMEFAGETFGPYVNEEVELPLNVSIFLIGKGVAKWI